mmetsp:Transcript_14663/g.39197  ORF Transcript_14663/g.39197 Transcript_14663/m.39197 type:complete len:217 (-) Transcript_14663:181-831(-)
MRHASERPQVSVDNTLICYVQARKSLRRLSTRVRLLGSTPSCSCSVAACSELVAVALFLALALCGLDAHLLVVLLQRRQVLASLGELTLLHALAHVPVHESALRVHEVELVVDAGENLCDGCGVADHAAGTHHLSQVTAGNHSRRLVVDTALEACGAPIHKLNGTLGLDSSDRCVHIFGHDVSTVHHTACHVLAMTRVALHVHGCGLEDGHGDLRH